MKSWQDFDKITLAQLPLFLFSATFFPVSAYPDAGALAGGVTPLYRGVVLCRELTTGARVDGARCGRCSTWSRWGWPGWSSSAAGSTCCCSSSPDGPGPRRPAPRAGRAIATGPTPCMAASCRLGDATERLQRRPGPAARSARVAGAPMDTGERRALGTGWTLAPAGRAACRRRPRRGATGGSRCQRLGQPGSLSLRTSCLELRRLAADLRRQVGGAALGVAVDEVERLTGPRAVRRRAVEAFEPGDDGGDLVLVGTAVRSSARGSAPACRSPTRQAGWSAFGASAATRAASDGDPARRASSSVSDSTATSATRGHLERAPPWSASACRPPRAGGPSAGRRGRSRRPGWPVSSRADLGSS